MTVNRRGILLISLLLMLTGCEQEREKPVLHTQVQPVHELEFPEKPDFMSVLSEMAPSRDGIYTTAGVVFNQSELLQKEIRVRGQIVSVSDDCPELTLPKAKRKQVLKEREKRDFGKTETQTYIRKCRQLHITINSPKDIGKPIVVTGYHPFYHPHFEKGMGIDVTGKYVLYTNGLVSATNGIIIADKLHDMGVDVNGNFTTSRAEISKMISRGELIDTSKDK